MASMPRRRFRRHRKQSRPLVCSRRQLPVHRSDVTAESVHGRDENSSERKQLGWKRKQHRLRGPRHSVAPLVSSAPPSSAHRSPLEAQGPPPPEPPPPPPPPQSSPGFNPWARPRPFGPRPMPFSPWASYQAPLPPHLWPEPFFRMTHHLAMHNIINELTAYIFTAGLNCIQYGQVPAGSPSAVPHGG